MQTETATATVANRFATKPVVRSNSGHQRAGRGYSMDELQEAGLDARIARTHKVPVDVWRKTKHPENVDWLKALAKTIKESRKEKINNSKSGNAKDEEGTKTMTTTTAVKKKSGKEAATKKEKTKKAAAAEGNKQ